jgi:hypothetical protein
MKSLRQAAAILKVGIAGACWVPMNSNAIRLAKLLRGHVGAFAVWNAVRRVDADIEARDVAAPPIIRFLSRPTAITNAHHLRACPLLQIARW